MSKEKLYAVKNDDGIYWDFSDVTGFWSIYLDIADCPITTSKKQAEEVADEHGGHIVTFVEEPKKVVLTKEQAEIVENARDKEYPATYISNETDVSNAEESLLINAYVNGWTVKRPQRWCVKTPDNWMGNGKQGWLYKITGCINTISEDHRECTPDEQFTAEEIKKYHLDGFEKVEVEENGGLDK